MVTALLPPVAQAFAATYLECDMKPSSPVDQEAHHKTNFQDKNNTNNKSLNFQLKDMGKREAVGSFPPLQMQRDIFLPDDLICGQDSTNSIRFAPLTTQQDRPQCTDKSTDEATTTNSLDRKKRELTGSDVIRPTAKVRKHDRTSSPRSNTTIVPPQSGIDTQTSAAGVSQRSQRHREGANRSTGTQQEKRYGGGGSRQQSHLNSQRYQEEQQSEYGGLEDVPYPRTEFDINRERSMVDSIVSKIVVNMNGELAPETYTVAQAAASQVYRKMTEILNIKHIELERLKLQVRSLQVHLRQIQHGPSSRGYHEANTHGDMMQQRHFNTTAPYTDYRPSKTTPLGYHSTWDELSQHHAALTTGQAVAGLYTGQLEREANSYLSRDSNSDQSSFASNERRFQAAAASEHSNRKSMPHIINKNSSRVDQQKSAYYSSTDLSRNLQGNQFDSQQVAEPHAGHSSSFQDANKLFRERPRPSQLYVGTGSAATTKLESLPAPRLRHGRLESRRHSITNESEASTDHEYHPAGRELQTTTSKYPKSRWSPEQDESLRHAVELYGGKKWKKIAEHVQGRNHVQCLQRWKKVLQPGLIKGPWTPQEDAILTKLLVEQKLTSWTQIANYVPGRTAKQCRERWTLSLDPSINRNAWTKTEDDSLLQLHLRLGNRWSEIKEYFNGRTENAVKSRYKSLARAQAKAWSEAQDEELMQAYRTCSKSEDDVDWKAMASMVSGRSEFELQLRVKALLHVPQASSPKSGQGH